jgi:Holliday junction resolvase-like predicted endonuclease
VGFDGETPVFGEVRTRELSRGETALPELSSTRGKHKVLIRTAHYFLRERHIGDCPLRFDVVALDSSPGRLPVVRLHEDAPQPSELILQTALRFLSRRGTIRGLWDWLLQCRVENDAWRVSLAGAT